MALGFYFVYPREGSCRTCNVHYDSEAHLQSQRMQSISCTLSPVTSLLLSKIHILFICIFLFRKQSSSWDSIFPSSNKNINSTTFVSELENNIKIHAWMGLDEQGFHFQVTGSLEAVSVCWYKHTYTFLPACKNPLAPLPLLELPRVFYHCVSTF